jgi:hypothetical protein
MVTDRRGVGTALSTAGQPDPSPTLALFPSASEAERRGHGTMVARLVAVGPNTGICPAHVLRSSGAIKDRLDHKITLSLKIRVGLPVD